MKKDSLVELASAIIDPYYEEMKQDANKTRPVSCTLAQGLDAATG